MNSATPGRPRPWIWAAALGSAAAVGVAASLLVAPSPPDAGPDPSEAALARAHDDAARLAAEASLLAGSPRPSGPPPSSDAVPASHVATVLRLQADVLGASLPSSAATSAVGVSARPSPPDSPSAQSQTSGAVPGTSAQDAAALAGELWASAAARHADLTTVDGPTAALLASVAVGQTVESERLAASAGSSMPGTSSATAASETPIPVAAGERACAPASAPHTGSGGTPANRAPSSTPTTPSAQPSTPSNATAPSAGAFREAVAAVQAAEQAGIWTYTVLAARTDASARTGNVAAAELHRSQLRALGAVARAACSELPPPPAGFALPPDPGGQAQLAQLEQSAAAAWSDLIAAADPPLRAAAADALLEAARRIAVVDIPGTAATSAFPGHPAAQAAALGATEPAASPSATR